MTMVALSRMGAVAGVHTAAAFDICDSLGWDGVRVVLLAACNERPPGLFQQYNALALVLLQVIFYRQPTC